jgi:hypothetical protein
MQNSARFAISPDGTTGTIGSGVMSGSGGGAGYTQTPRAPTGLGATTGIDLLAQTNNAFVNLTWANSPSTDVVTNFEVQWRKYGDTLYYHARTGVASVKIPGLIQGQLYSFSVRAQNDLGNYSPYSSELTVVAGADLIAPATPTGLTAIRTTRGALVSWTGNSTDRDLQGYVLQVSVAGSRFTPVVTAPSLLTSFAYIAPSGTPIGSTLVFQVAAVDWSANQSAWSTASANTPTDGVYFDEVMTGNLTATGTITGGLIRTAPSGARVEMDNAGIRLLDGTATDYGAGAGITTRLRSTDGAAFFSGVVSASSIVSNSPAGMPSMTINMVSTPQMLVNDGIIDRVQIGALPSGDYGISVVAADGTAILDSAGLQNVASNIGGVSVPAGLAAAQPFTTSWTNYPITNDVFQLTRTGTAQVLAMINFFTTGGSASYGLVRIAVFNGVGTLVGASIEGVHTNGSGISSATPYLLFRNYPPDTYTVWIQYMLSAGASTTLQIYSSQWNAFQMGS